MIIYNHGFIIQEYNSANKHNKPTQKYKLISQLS